MFKSKYFFQFVTVLILGGTFSGCAGAPKCGTCTTIEKNETLIDEWIDGIADALDGGRYVPGNPNARPPTEPTILLKKPSSVLGGIGTFALSLATGGRGTSIAKGMAGDHLTCTPDELCQHCPPKPKIIINCGQACGEEADKECLNAADDCFDAMLTAAAGSHRNGSYTATRVKTAMKSTYNSTPECQKVKGIHAQCGQGGHLPGCQDQTHQNDTKEEVKLSSVYQEHSNAQQLNEIEALFQTGDFGVAE